MQTQTAIDSIKFAFGYSGAIFSAVNFTYRLAPEFQHPAGLEDMNSVAEWLMNNADKYGLDTANIFGIGDSAGANGIGLYAAILTNPDYAAQYDFTAPKGFAFKGVGLLCGTYRIDLENYDDEVTMPLIAEYMPNGGTIPCNVGLKAAHKCAEDMCGFFRKYVKN